MITKKKNNNIEYFTVEHAIKMLPLIKSYCRDLEKLSERHEFLGIEDFRINRLTSTSKDEKETIKRQRIEIKEEMIFLRSEAKIWKTELDDLNLYVCSAKLGRINIPVFDNETQKTIFLCIHKNTKKDSLEWHSIKDTHENALLYLYPIKKKGELLLPSSTDTE